MFIAGGEGCHRRRVKLIEVFEWDDQQEDEYQYRKSGGALGSRRES